VPNIPTISDLGGQGKGALGFGGTLSDATFSDVGTGVSDIFGGFADQTKAQGDRLEASNYRLAAQFADQNAVYTQWSTDIKEAQQTREITKSMGQTAADVAGAGFAAAGSALDILRESASQGALTKAVLNEQGLITQAGYKEQAASYNNMAQAADMAAHAEEQAATGSFIAGGIKTAAAIATLA
jgi:hypothetical protein